MIFSGNRFPLFRIMLQLPGAARAQAAAATLAMSEAGA